MLLARWPVILLLCLAGAAGAFAYSSRAPQVYRATAQLSVTASIIEYWTGQAVERQLNNYAWRMRSQLFAQEVAARLPSGGGPAELLGRIRAVAAPSDFRIAIEVDDADPTRARDIANAAAQAWVAKIRAEAAGKERFDISIEVGEFAAAPRSPISPRPKLSAAAGALLGVVLGCLLALLLEYLEDSVRTARDVQELLGLPILGAIPGAATASRFPILDGRSLRSPMRARVSVQQAGAQPEPAIGNRTSETG